MDFPKEFQKTELFRNAVSVASREAEESEFTEAKKIKTPVPLGGQIWTIWVRHVCALLASLAPAPCVPILALFVRDRRARPLKFLVSIDDVGAPCMCIVCLFSRL